MKVFTNLGGGYVGCFGTGYTKTFPSRTPPKTGIVDGVCVCVCVEFGDAWVPAFLPLTAGVHKTGFSHTHTQERGTFRVAESRRGVVMSTFQLFGCRSFDGLNKFTCEAVQVFAGLIAIVCGTVFVWQTSEVLSVWIYIISWEKVVSDIDICQEIFNDEWHKNLILKNLRKSDIINKISVKIHNCQHCHLLDSKYMYTVDANNTGFCINIFYLEIEYGYFVNV